MSQEIKKELLPKLREKYAGKGIKAKTALINEVCKDWGYERKYAIKLFRQLNLLTVFQEKILSSTKKAAPEKYETAKKATIGKGRSYPDGFTIDVVPVQSKNDVALKLPLKIHSTLTSNPKQLENFPNLNAEMDGIVKANGTIEVKNFQLLD